MIFIKYHKIKYFKTKYNIDELWRDYTENKTIENRNKLIEHYLYLLYKPVKNIYPVCRNVQEMSDIFQSAVIGLIEAVEYYSKDKNASFETFSRWRIHGSIIDYLRKSNLISVPYKVRKINPDRINIVSLDDLNETVIDSLQSDVLNSVENQIEDKIMLENIYKALKKLPFDQYSTIAQYYFLGRTLEEIAINFKMTRSGVWQIRKRAINNIRKIIMI